jgi:mitochondrial fission protein ELM1
MNAIKWLEKLRANTGENNLKVMIDLIIEGTNKKAALSKDQQHACSRAIDSLLRRGGENVFETVMLSDFINGCK